FGVYPIDELRGFQLGGAVPGKGLGGGVDEGEAAAHVVGEDHFGEALRHGAEASVAVVERFFETLAGGGFLRQLGFELKADCGVGHLQTMLAPLCFGAEARRHGETQDETQGFLFPLRVSAPPRRKDYARSSPTNLPVESPKCSMWTPMRSI